MLPLYEYLLQQMIIFSCCSPLVYILFVCLDLEFHFFPFLCFSLHSHAVL